MCEENKMLYLKAMKKIYRKDRLGTGSYRLLAKHIRLNCIQITPMLDSLVMFMQMQDGTRMLIFLPDRRFDIMTMRWL